MERYWFLWDITGCKLAGSALPRVAQSLLVTLYLMIDAGHILVVYESCMARIATAVRFGT
jgi:hypothetical protein